MSTVSTVGFLMSLMLQGLNSLVSSAFILKCIVNPSILAVSLSDWTTQFRQTAPDSWDSAQFDPSRWDHYALVIVFIGISSWGLWLSRSWHQEKRQRKGQSNLVKESRKG